MEGGQKSSDFCPLGEGPSGTKRRVADLGLLRLMVVGDGGEFAYWYRCTYIKMRGRFQAEETAKEVTRPRAEGIDHEGAKAQRSWRAEDNRESRESARVKKNPFAPIRVIRG